MALPISDSSFFARTRDDIEKAQDTAGKTQRATQAASDRSARSQASDARRAGGRKFDEGKIKRKGGGWGKRKVKGAGQFASKGGSGEGNAGFAGPNVKTNNAEGNPRKGKKYMEVKDPKGRGMLHVYEDGSKFLVRDRAKGDFKKDAEGHDMENFSEDAAEYGITKSDGEKRRTMGPLYMPNVVDAHGEFVTSQELEDAAAEFVRKGKFSIRHQHRPGTVIGEVIGVMAWPYETEVELLLPATVAKTMSTGDFGGAGQAPLSVDQGLSRVKRKLPAGTVYATVEWTPQAWPLVKSGKIGGFSMGGRAVRVRGASPASEGRKPEMQNAAGFGVGEAGHGHLSGPPIAGQQVAGGAYDGMSQVGKSERRERRLALCDEGSQVEILKRALEERGGDDLVNVRPDGDEVPHEIDRCAYEEAYEDDDDDEPGGYDPVERDEPEDDDAFSRVLLLAAMGNRAAQRMVQTAMGSNAD